MKNLSFATLALLSASVSPAAIVYVNLSDLVVPYTDEGVYVNILSGDTATEFPADFDDAPWLNLYYGGSRIFTSNLLRPAASTASYVDTDPGSYFLNVGVGTIIDGSATFVGTGSVSTNHIGLTSNQFQSEQRGYLGFAYEATSGGGVSYGWISISPSLTGSGFSFDLAYSDTPGEAIEVGAVPEPSTYAALIGASVLVAAGAIRRRRVG